VKVLILGSGGREHALAWRLRQDPGVTGVITAPGNPGTASLGLSFAGNLREPREILSLARGAGVDLTVVGPEAPL
jgi:phosphoribosylamine--glycine ligase